MSERTMIVLTVLAGLFVVCQPIFFYHEIPAALPSHAWAFGLGLFDGALIMAPILIRILRDFP